MALPQLADSPVSMVDRVVLIFEVFERSGGHLRLGQIASRTGLPRSSVHRILQQLVDARWLHRDGTEYTMGLRVFELGSLVAHRSRISTVARPLLHDLGSASAFAVHLAILDRHDVLYLEKVGGDFAAALPSRVGGRLPAHCTAVGKALLAFSPPSVIEDYVAHGLTGRTTASICSRDDLIRELDGIRECGFATEYEEALPGVACIGSPIREAGFSAAALSLCAPRDRLDITDVKHRVLWTAAEISRRLSATPRSGPVPHLIPMG